MERDRDASRADLADDEVLEDDEEITESPRDADEADALDQHRAARPDGDRDEPASIPPDVPEADALEQSRDVPEDDELRDE